MSFDQQELKKTSCVCLGWIFPDSETLNVPCPEPFDLLVMEGLYLVVRDAWVLLLPLVEALVLPVLEPLSFGSLPRVLPRVKNPRLC